MLGSLQTRSQRVSGVVINQLHAYWPWLALLVLGLLTPVLLVIAGPLTLPIARKLNQRRARRQCLGNLKRACQADDAAAARGELLEWGRSHWCNDRINGLQQQLASREWSRPRSQQWHAELARLDAAIYSNEMGDWRGQALWKLVRQAHKTETHSRLRPISRRTDLLPELYPRAKIKQAL